ncbi:MAG TPA: c-type cytochrome domain-containing protein, partial [Lacipirellulaceae bacterium]|nr:c-type cytochrome domain-containing protein [Lacipirellulaceae bacterium]
MNANTSRAADAPIPVKIEFNRDVRPILSDNCFHCHGPDKNARQAEMRLDIRDEAVKAASSGATPLLPGKPDESEVVRRINSTDADEM